MIVDIDISRFRYDGTRGFSIADSPTAIEPLYGSVGDYRAGMDEFRAAIDERQRLMYAHDRYAMLLVFQAMDAAGKDGTIRSVLSGVNPHGVDVHAFKRPSGLELDHNYMWRTDARMPRRGTIGIFNRSYYEEVLVCRVHPEIVSDFQRVPPEFTRNFPRMWKQRYADIRGMEDYNHHNGTRIVKFFLHLSKDEQARRFLSRIDREEKNWKFEEGDLRERGYWDDYQEAYEDCINATATRKCPWYIIPADDKPNMRLIVSRVILEHLQALDMHYPEVDEERKANFAKYRAQLERELE
jgi:PPK2 family polyphosphate:nucleotide phosphotransferase